jgi:RNA polymerase sigma factor (sigma-70 family)
MGPISTVLRFIRGVPEAADSADATDQQLLKRFVEGREQVAFENLLHRHEAAVLAVCRRVLGHEQDAEDAFQATFLVLARKAASLLSGAGIGSWLYGVANRTALKAKVANARRRRREATAAIKPEQEQKTASDWSDLLPVFDQEMQRLPSKLRATIVLCDVEGKTRTEAARELGWPEGTLSWRLASARSLLAARLKRHGITLSATALAVAIAENASASVPAILSAATAQAAGFSLLDQAVAAGQVSANVAALTKGVLRTMFYQKIKIAVVICLALSAVGTGAVLAWGIGAKSPEGRMATAQQATEVAENPVVLAQGNDRAPAKAPDLRGPITEISADGKVLTVGMAAGGGGGKQAPLTEVKLTDKTKMEFTILAKDLRRKLKVGDVVFVNLENGAASTVRVTPAADVRGSIMDISADGKTLTVKSPPKRKGESAQNVNVKVTDKTIIVKAPVRVGETGEATQPQVGAAVSVYLIEGSNDVAAAMLVHDPARLGGPQR